MPHGLEGLFIMFFEITRPVLFCTALLLAACGGGGGESPTENPPPPSNPDTAVEPAGMRAATNELLGNYTNPISYTDLTRVPTTGSAIYQGYYSGDLANSNDDLPNSLIGNLTIEVKFGSVLSLTGRADNFFDETNAAVAGALTLSTGELNRSGNPNQDATLVMIMEGQLTDSDDHQMDLASQMEGDFIGAQHNAIGGAVFGRVTSEGAIQDFDGSFIAAR